MKYIECEYEDEVYRCRVVKDKDENELIIGTTKLLDAIQPRDLNFNDGFVDKEAEELYNKIFYFVNVDEINLEDHALIKILKEENPEWFEK